MTPAQLRAYADDCDRRARDFIAAGKLREAAEVSHLAEAYRQVADEQERLPKRGPRSTVVPVRTEEHREAQSRALVDNPPMKAARAAGYPSVRAVAAKLDVDATFISKVFRGKKPMPEDLAARFERLTGYPAKSWKS